MKKCSYCGAEYPDDAVACAIDQTSLLQIETISKSNQRELPFSLKIASWFFLYLGIMGLLWLIYGIRDLAELWARGFPFSFALVFHFLFGPAILILGFWIFLGLRRFSHRWRICALVMIWYLIINCLLILAYLLFGAQFHIRPFDPRLINASKNWLLLKFSLGLILVIWQCQILMRRNIRDLFIK